MKADTQKAKQMLSDKGCTCVLCRDGKFYTSTERGVKPLLDWLDSGIDMKDFCACDKVVGNAAAFLYVLLGVSEVYAHVISGAALKTLKKNGVSVYFDLQVSEIRNRTNTGACPMEEATAACVIAEDAEKAVRKRLKELQGK